MPVVSLHPNLLRKMTGVEISDEKLKEDLFNLGLEFDGEDEDGNFVRQSELNQQEQNERVSKPTTKKQSPKQQSPKSQSKKKS